MPNNNKLYLVALALGPVQDFIAAARRTRDLWFGSFLLSEISKAAAYYLYKHCKTNPRAGLIFPATEQPEIDLKPCQKNLDAGGNPPFNAPNKLLAVIETNDPKGVLEEAKQAAKARWKELAEAVFDEGKKSILKEKHIDKDIWNAQLKDQLELFAAWVEYNPEEDQYATKRGQLERLLAARKNSRNFDPSTVAGDRIPKSSLDGLRESVIDGAAFKPWERRRFSLSDGEQLDCPGLVKRLGGEPEQFTPLSRIAVDPWLRSLKKNNIELPVAVTERLDVIHKTNLGLVSRVRGCHDNQLQFDGQLLYPFRIDAELMQINKLPVEQRKDVPEQLKGLKKEITIFTKKYGEPSPYVAILAADGDRMGKLIDAAKSEEEHRSISKILSNFAKAAATIVKKYHGQLIYAGGDDVLAIVPLDKMLECAKGLEEQFTDGWKKPELNGKNKPTLSIGIGISHMLIPMGRQLELAREAEKNAKANQHPKSDQRKNGLAILYQPRSGDRIELREQWCAEPEKILDKWRQLHESRELPFRAAYQLRKLDRAINSWCKPGQDLPEEDVKKFFKDEIQRVLERKRIEKNKKVDPAVIDVICDRGKTIGLGKLADELILTQKLAQQTMFKKTKKQKERDHG
ncbi:MAG: type III-B CRISPR-associated protein Cas10/Cmr2 [Planctomycetaceae bacterium]|nr:type III-B CRISPR-associated protein Cas10/Cmr2 [Planctomycetaceae bacterium]